MSLTLKTGGGGDFQIAPAGNHLGICYQMVDLGHQLVTYKENGVTKEKYQSKVLIGFELPNETMEDGRPFIVSRRFTSSLAKTSALRPILESWRGRPFSAAEEAGFELKNVLGKACMVNVVHATPKDKTYANITSVTPVPKGMDVPEMHNEIQYFEFGDQGFDEATFNGLSDGLKRVISESKDYQMLTGSDQAVASQEELSDEIPF